MYNDQPADAQREQLLRELRRNRLLSDVLAEGYVPSADAALRERLRQQMHRRVRLQRLTFATAASAALIVAAALVAAFGATSSNFSIPEPIVRQEAPAQQAAERYQVVRTQKVLHGAAASNFTVINATGAPTFVSIALSAPPAYDESRSRKATSFQISSAHPALEIVSSQPRATPERITDAELLGASTQVVAIFGSPNGPKRLVLQR